MPFIREIAEANEHKMGPNIFNDKITQDPRKKFVVSLEKLCVCVCLCAKMFHGSKRFGNRLKIRPRHSMAEFLLIR